MTDKILDCHHEDITHIVDARAVARLHRKISSFLRYTRRYQRIRYAR